MQRRPLIFPGYIAVRLPIALSVLSFFGCVMLFKQNTSTTQDKLAVCALLSLSAVIIVILARSGADYAGVRHTLTIYFVLSILMGFAMRYLADLRTKVISVSVFGFALLTCLPALAVKRPWEYHNILGGGTSDAYRFFRNDGVDLGQRDKEIADYCHRKLEPNGEVPYLIYYPSFIKPDLIGYRHLRVQALIDRDGDFLPPVTVSGTFIVLATVIAPAMWSDYKALRDAQPVDRMGNVLVYRGTYYLPNVRADALLDRAQTLLEEPKPELVKIEKLLNEGLELRPTDFGGWMMLGNLNLLRGDREDALVAYRKARDVTPPSPFQKLFDEQIRMVSTRALSSVTPMRDPGIE